MSTQIIQGAPFDVFVSADEEYPKNLQKAGATANTPKVYACGTLVLWTTKSGLSIKADGKILSNNRVQKIAIANPKTAPYGRAAIEWLKKKGLYAQVEHKLVYGESVAQTSQYILAGACEIGLTAKSMVMAEEMRGKGSWVEIDIKYYEHIRQAADMVGVGVSRDDVIKRLYALPAKICDDMVAVAVFPRVNQQSLAAVFYKDGVRVAHVHYVYLKI